MLNWGNQGSFHYQQPEVLILNKVRVRDGSMYSIQGWIHAFMMLIQFSVNSKSQLQCCNLSWQQWHKMRYSAVEAHQPSCSFVGHSEMAFTYLCCNERLFQLLLSLRHLSLLILLWPLTSSRHFAPENWSSPDRSFFSKPFSARCKPSRLMCEEIPVDQQFVKYWDQPVWHQKLCHFHPNSLAWLK